MAWFGFESGVEAGVEITHGICAAK